MNDEREEVKPESEVGVGEQPTAEQIALKAARVKKKHFDSMTQPLKQLDNNIKKLKNENLELAVATKEAFKVVMKTCGANKDKIKANKENPAMNNSTANKELWEEIKKTMKNFYWPENLQKGVEGQLSDLQGMMEQKPDLVDYMADLGAEGKVEINSVVSDVNSKQAELDKDVKDATSDLGKEEVDAEQDNREKFEQSEAENRQTTKENKQKDNGNVELRPRSLVRLVQELRGVRPNARNMIKKVPIIPVIQKMIANKRKSRNP